jgi:hypothetical protein
MLEIMEYSLEQNFAECWWDHWLYIRFVFGDSFHLQQDSKRVLLCPTNREARSLNVTVLSMMDGESVTSTSIDEVFSDPSDRPIPLEVLNSLNLSNFPMHLLEMKRNCPLT